VAGVITINAGGGIYIKEAFEQFRKFGKNLVKNRPAWLRYCPGMDWAFGGLMVHRRLHRHWGKRRLHDFLIADEMAALGALLETTTEAEVHLLPQLTSQLSQPVYFLAGQEDRVMELKYVRHLASFHPLFHEGEGNLREIPQCGHLAMVEQPQAVIDNLRAILLRHSC
jgi:pimeloyl-ACP methyl ester carboxylesterase